MSWIKIWKSKKRNYGWRHVNKACEYLSHNYNHPLPTKIIALARGGLVPATIMANRLGVRHVYSLGVSSYEKQADGKETPGAYEMYQRIPTNIRKHGPDDFVLIVDDISDKGGTFEYAEQYIKQIIGGNIVTMSLVIKPETKHKPTYFYEEVDQDKWIVFPWERS